MRNPVRREVLRVRVVWTDPGAEEPAEADELRSTEEEADEDLDDPAEPDAERRPGMVCSM